MRDVGDGRGGDVGALGARMASRDATLLWFSQHTRAECVLLIAQPLYIWQLVGNRNRLGRHASSHRVCMCVCMCVCVCVYVCVCVPGCRLFIECSFVV